jgi:hypothetical protein
MREIDEVTGEVVDAELMWFRPGGSFHNSPAIQSLSQRSRKTLFRPGGTIETVSRMTAFARPCGTQTTLAAHLPSSEETVRLFW